MEVPAEQSSGCAALQTELGLDCTLRPELHLSALPFCGGGDGDDDDGGGGRRQGQGWQMH